MKYFCCTTAGNCRTTFTVEADNPAEAKELAERQAPRGAAIELSCDCGPPRLHPYPMTDADFEAEGRRIALEGMDLPDGAYCAMAEELGLDPY